MNKTLDPRAARRNLLAGAIALAMSTICLAAAATPDDDQTDPGDGGQSGKTRTTELKKIVVTAEKRAVNLQKTGISIAVVDPETMRDEHKLTLSDITSAIPGVQLQSTETGPQFSVRSVGATGRPGGEQAVPTYRDGVVFDRVDSARAMLLDVAQVEVLMGPQGTLYGRNALGGAINITYNQPVLGSVEGSAGLGFGNYGLVEGNAVLNLPLSQVLALRLAVSAAKRDGYLNNGRNDQDDRTARVKLRYAPSQDLDMVFTFEQSHLGGKGDGTSDVSANWPDRSGWDPWYDDDTSDVYKHTKSQLASLNLQWRTDAGTLFVLPAHLKNSYDAYQVANGVAQAEDRSKSQDSLEVRFASPDDQRVVWQVGTYYYRADEPQDFVTYVATEPANGYPDDQTPKNLTRSVAAFGQATTALSDTLRLITGARYTRDRRILHYAGGDFANGGSGALATATYDYSKPSWRLGLEWDVAAATMLYATVSTGYRSGDVSGSPFGITGNPAQEMTNYALGIKSRFLDNTLQLNAELYHSDYKNFPIGLSYQASADSPPTAYSTVAKGLKIQGLDLSIDYALTAADRFNLAFNYLDAKFGTQPAFNDTSVTDAATFASFAAQLANFSGAVKPFAPRTSADLSYEHDWDLAGGGTIALRPNVHYSASSYVSTLTVDVNDPKALQPSYWLYNLFVTYTAASGQWGAGVYGRNLSNEAVVTNYSQAMSSATVDTVNVAAPRTYGVQFWLKF
ncbi:MAG: TonB-dependent receptor [Pseudoxanthomonas sp.]